MRINKVAPELEFDVMQGLQFYSFGCDSNDIVDYIINNKGDYDALESLQNWGVVVTGRKKSLKHFDNESIEVIVDHKALREHKDFIYSLFIKPNLTRDIAGKKYLPIHPLQINPTRIYLLKSTDDALICINNIPKYTFKDLDTNKFRFFEIMWIKMGKLVSYDELSKVRTEQIQNKTYALNKNTARTIRALSEELIDLPIDITISKGATLQLIPSESSCPKKLRTLALNLEGLLN